MIEIIQGALIEISEDYCNIARKRVQDEHDKMGLFNGDTK